MIEPRRTRPPRRRARERLALPERAGSARLRSSRGDDGARRARSRCAPTRAPEAARRAAIDAAREEIAPRAARLRRRPRARARSSPRSSRRRCPSDLSESFRGELAEVRHELVAVRRRRAAVQPRAARRRPAGELGPSNNARLRDVRAAHARRRRGHRPRSSSPARARALAHYGIDDLEPLRRARARACCACSPRRPRPSCGAGSCSACLARVHALAGSGDPPRRRPRARRRARADRRRCAACVSRRARRRRARGALRDLRGPATRAPGRAHDASRLEAWLAAAEARADARRPRRCSRTSPMRRARSSTASGGWLADADPRRRAIALAAHVRRALRAPAAARAHAPSVVGPVHVERLELAGGRIVLGAACAARRARADARARSAAPRAPRECARRAGASTRSSCSCRSRRATRSPGVARGDRAAARRRRSPAGRLTLTLLRAGGPRPAPHASCRRASGLRARRPRCTASTPRPPRASTSRGCASFELERLRGARGPLLLPRRAAATSPATSACFVLADVRGALAATTGHEAEPARAGLRARLLRGHARAARASSAARDPQRRLQWNRDRDLPSAPPVYLDREPRRARSRAASRPRRATSASRRWWCGCTLLDRDAARARRRAPIEIVISRPRPAAGSSIDVARAAHAAARARAATTSARSSRRAAAGSSTRTRSSACSPGAPGAVELAAERRAARRRRSRSTTSTPTREHAARDQRRGPPAGREHERDRVRHHRHADRRRCPRACGACSCSPIRRSAWARSPRPSAIAIVAAIDLAEALRAAGRVGAGLERRAHRDGQRHREPRRDRARGAPHRHVHAGAAASST